MAEVKTREFNQGAAAALQNAPIQDRLGKLYSGFHQAREAAAQATDNWEELRERAREIKQHTIDNLDYYLELLEQNVIKHGGQVYFAKDSTDANAYIVNLVRSRGVKLITKSKSMVSEEMGINHVLQDIGVEAVETDLGEYIIQLAEETPYHIIAPALHKSKEEISDLFSDRLGTQRYEQIPDLTSAAREILRDKFSQADMGITGINFAIAETGTIAIVTNEGNGRMCTSMPKIHVALMGMEKVIPSLMDLGLFLRLLTRSATGQWITSYVTSLTGPRRGDDEDGPEEFHLVIIDNGRSRMLRDPELREALFCIRCGACLNACPVYRKVGGHAYGWVYSGPIGKIVTPMLVGLSQAKDLPFASTLCGNCREVCPIKIDIPRMLLKLRHDISEGPTNPSDKKVSLMEKVSIRLWHRIVASPFLFEMANRVGNLLQRPLLRRGRIKKLPPPFSGWTKYRNFPALSQKPFRAFWREHLGNKGKL